MTDPDYLSLHKLGIGYSGAKKDPLFRNITAHVPKGGLIGLFGRNGIGKSTLLRTLAGLQPACEGKLILFGRELRRLTPADIARQIAFVPSQPLRTPRLSVADMVGVGRYGFTNWIGSEQKSDKEAINFALEVTSLTHLAKQDSSTLSDGELQRASIARSIVQDTPVVLLDEPTAFLDMGNKYKTVYLLKELAGKAQKGIVFSTHDLNLALQVCDILWIMEDNGFHADTPEALINEGVLDSLFAGSALIFDRSTLSYRPK